MFARNKGNVGGGHVPSQSSRTSPDSSAGASAAGVGNTRIVTKTYGVRSTPEEIIQQVQQRPTPAVVGDSAASYISTSWPALYVIPILNGNTYEQLGSFFEYRIVELDDASRSKLDILDLDDPRKSGPFFKERQTTAERAKDERAAAAYAEAVQLAGGATVHRLIGMNRLATLLGVSYEDQPCLVFLRPGCLELVELLPLDPAWYASPAVRTAFGEAFRRWIAELKLDGVAHPAGSGDPFDRTVRAAVQRLSMEVGLAVSGAVPADQTCAFYRNGDLWHLAFDGQSAVVAHLIGMDYIADLLAQPGADIPAIAIRTARVGETGLLPFTRMEHLDGKARTEAMARLSKIQEERAAAEESGAREKVDELDEEANTIDRMLGAATGLGGRSRYFSTDDGRTAGSNAIDRAIRAVERALPPLGLHLRRSIRKGSIFSYRPDHKIYWVLRASLKRNKSPRPM